MLLVNSLGASSATVYLTESLVGQAGTNLIPVVAYPSEGALVDPPRLLTAGSNQLPGQLSVADDPPSMGGDLLSSQTDEIETIGALSPEQDLPRSKVSINPALPSLSVSFDQWRVPQENEQQVVLPLAHEGVVLGVLVTTRSDRDWSRLEKSQLEQFANTLANARVLDQRGQWLQQQLHQKQIFRDRQSDVLHDLLHQFRNPLTSLRTFGKLLLKRLNAEDMNQPIANSIVRESERLQNLLHQFEVTVDLDDEVEDLSVERSQIRVLPPADPKVQDLAVQSAAHTGDLSPSPALPAIGMAASLTLGAVTVVDVLRPLIVAADAIAQEKSITLISHLPEGLPPVWADASALQEVLSNLIDNALKYSPWGATAMVQTGLQRQEGDQFWQGILVADTGPGIPMQDQGHVFERHYRGVQAETNIPGTGLGLAIAKVLIEQMQGTIQVISPLTAYPNLMPADDTEDVSSHPVHGPGTAFLIWLPEIPPTSIP